MIKIIKLILIVAVITGINACKKEGSISDVKNLEVGSYLTLDQKVNDILDATLPSSTVSIKVTEKGSAVDKIKIYVSVNTKTQNKALWKFIKEVPYSAGVTLVVSNAEIKTAIGTNVVPGVTYWLYNELIQKDGGVHSFANTFNEYESNPNYNMALTWRAISVCPFNAAAAAGTYTITVDGWDGAAGETAVVTATANSAVVNLLFPYAANPGLAPVTLTINPTTGGVTVAKQVYGSYGSGFENFAASGSGFFFSCTGTIDLSLKHELGATNYGTYRIVLKK